MSTFLINQTMGNIERDFRIINQTKDRILKSISELNKCNPYKIGEEVLVGAKFESLRTFTVDEITVRDAHMNNAELSGLKPVYFVASGFAQDSDGVLTNDRLVDTIKIDELVTEQGCK